MYIETKEEKTTHTMNSGILISKLCVTILSSKSEILKSESEKMRRNAECFEKRENLSLIVSADRH